MVQLGRIKNPQKIGEDLVLCLVEIKEGDGVGAKFEWLEYVAGRGDVAATGNEVWRRLCEGDFTCDDGFDLNFDPSDLIPDDPPEPDAELEVEEAADASGAA